MGCPEMKPEIIFEKPVPGLKVNLAKKLGDSFQVVDKSDTIKYRIEYQKEYKINYLIAEKNDTMFVGTVTKRNEMFLLNHKYEDGTYRIHAIKFDGATITGLGQSWYQSSVIKSEIDQGNYLDLIVDSASEITLKANIRKGKQLFRNALDNIEPMILIQEGQELEDIDLEREPGPTHVDEEIHIENSSSMIVNVYPNPVIDFVNVELNSDYSRTLRLLNLNGQVMKVIEGKRTSIQMNLSDYKAGTYILEITNSVTGSIETKKLIKN